MNENFRLADVAEKRGLVPFFNVLVDPRDGGVSIVATLLVRMVSDDVFERFKVELGIALDRLRNTPLDDVDEIVFS